MKLVYSDSDNAEVKCGDVIHLSNRPYYIVSIVKPHKPSSTGRVMCKAMDENGWTSEWFPSVIGAEWIDRTDQ